MAISRTWILLLSLFVLGPVHAEEMEVDADADIAASNVEAVTDADVMVADEEYDLLGSAGEVISDAYDAIAEEVEEISNQVDLYPEPQMPTAFEVDTAKSCIALDNEIVAMIPLTHRTVPDFYNDPVNAAAIFLGTTGVIIDVTVRDVPIWYSFLGYTGYQKLKQEERVRRANLRIDSLRRVKAQKRCFET